MVEVSLLLLHILAVINTVQLQSDVRMTQGQEKEMRTDRKGKYSHLGLREGVLKKRGQPRQEGEEGAGGAEVRHDHGTVVCGEGREGV